MLAHESGDEEVAVIVALTQFVNKRNLSFRRGYRQVLRQQLVFFQKLIFTALVYEKLQRWAVVFGDELGGVEFLPCFFIGSEVAGKCFFAPSTVDWVCYWGKC